jgi:hypothetical protein
MQEGFDLYGHRVASSTFNSFIYISPYGLCKLFNLINRIDISYNKKDKLKYKNSYEELIGINYETL